MYNTNMDIIALFIKDTLTLELFLNDLSLPLRLQLLRTFVPLLTRHRVKTLEAMPTLQNTSLCGLLLQIGICLDI